jgi:hypothetical protein
VNGWGRKQAKCGLASTEKVIPAPIFSKKITSLAESTGRKHPLLPIPQIEKV